MPCIPWKVIPQFLLLSIFIALSRFSIEKMLAKHFVKHPYFQTRQTRKLFREITSFLYYSIACAMEFTYCIKHGILKNLELCWIDYIDVISFDANRIYQTEMVYYLSATFYSILIYTSAKTQVELIVHHIVTLSLLAFSYIMSSYHMGIVMFLIHNFSEIFVCFAKAMLDLAYIDAAIVGFVLVLITWFVCRLVYFPLFAIRSTAVDCYRHMVADGRASKSLWITTLFFCFTVFVLNVSWFKRFILLLKNLIKARSDEVKESEKRKEKEKRAETCLQMSSALPEKSSPSTGSSNILPDSSVKLDESSASNKHFTSSSSSSSSKPSFDSNDLISSSGISSDSSSSLLPISRPLAEYRSPSVLSRPTLFSPSPPPSLLSKEKFN